MNTQAAMMRTHIRWMIRIDFPEVLAIERGGFIDPWGDKELTRHLRRPNLIGMVAEDIARIDVRGMYPVAGHMVYSLEKGRIDLLRLAVAPEYRRRGVGRQMLAKLQGKLSVERRTSVTAAVPDSMLGAHLWLRDCGWRAEGVDDDTYLFRYELPAV